MERRNTWLAVIFAALVIVLAGYLASRLRAQPQSVAIDFRPIAELATVEYTGVVEIANERVPDDIRARFGVSESVLMLVYGTVKAGFDLSGVGDGAVWTDGERVQVVLPPPVVLTTAIDTRRTRVVTHERSFLLAADPSLVDEAIEQGESALRDEALDAGLLDRARTQGRLLMETYLRQLGFTEVRVIVR